MSEQATELRAILSVGLTVAAGDGLQESFQQVQQQVQAGGGWLFRRELQGLWCSFPCLTEALRAAYRIFRSDRSARFGFRFGLHLGDVTVTAAGDVLGHVLSVAKRLETATPAGSLLISQEARERLTEIPDGLQVEPVAALELKGVGRLAACRVTFPPLGLVESLGDDEWHSFQRGELLVCMVGPLGGTAELQSLQDSWSAPGFFYEVAEDREAEFGRASLEADFRRWGQKLPPFPALQSALGEHGIPCLAFFPDPRLSHLSCLGGDLVLTEQDLDRLWARLTRELHGWEQALTAQTVFWVGPADWVEIFHREVRRRFPAGPEQPQFLIELGGEGEWERWRRRGFRIFHGLEQLTQLAARLSQPAVQPDALVESDRPYRFLDPFGAKDRALFFGRDRESALLHSWILTRRWLVLYGRSGVGKSSLLGAGVLPVLADSGVWVWTVRCLLDPLAQIEARCGAPLPGGLKALLATCPRRLVIVFDQFEEFFVRLSPTQRRPVAELLQQITSDPEFSRLHLLFSLREDFLAELAALEEWIPTLLDSRFRLTALTREQARQSIVGPARLFQLDIDDELVEVLLDDLESQGVEPPELQIVMDRLWDFRQGDRVTLASYRRLGGVRSVLLDYLHEALEGPLSQGPWGPELPRQLMRALVTERGTKSALTLPALESLVPAGGDFVKEMVGRLVDLRLVRSVAGEVTYYELSHEVLIEEIQSWASEDELALRHAQMVLHSELESWESLGSLISADRLTMVVREISRASLAWQPSPAEFQLLLRASMVHGTALGMAGDESADLLLRMLDEEWDGLVLRRVLAQLAKTSLTDYGQQRFLRAARENFNPTLLEATRTDLTALQGERFYEAVARATRQRFFGEQAMAHVPAGPAWLGSTPANRQQRKEQLPTYWHGRIDSEQELAQVELSAFWIDRTPVTNLQFAEFRPTHINRYPVEEHFHPVVSVSWHDAQAYASWLGKELVCEARWEKAARGSQGNLFPWGNDYQADRLNGQHSGLRSTSAVQAFPAGVSPYGCLDMAGNVWEWTASAWSEGGPFKVQKGGSTLNPAPLQQCSTRLEAFPDFVLQWVGFRLMSLGGA